MLPIDNPRNTRFLELKIAPTGLDRFVFEVLVILPSLVVGDQSCSDQTEAKLRCFMTSLFRLCLRCVLSVELQDRPVIHVVVLEVL